MALPRIWLDDTKDPTKEANIKLFIDGASQPSPSKAFVPIKTLKTPSSKSLVMIPTRAFLALSDPVTKTKLSSPFKVVNTYEFSSP